MLALVLQYCAHTLKQDTMKNFTFIIAILCISFSTTAKDRVYNRLDRLYHSDAKRCLKISERYIKYLPDNHAPYFFASVVYRDKSKKHLELKTRYMLMSKSIGLAMKFESFEDLDMQIKINWESYLEELRLATFSLIDEMEQTELAQYGDRLAFKHQKMIERREDIYLIASSSHGATVTIPASGGEASGTFSGASSDTGSSESSSPSDPVVAAVEEEAVPVSDESQNVGHYGLASGREDIASFNKIQERELLNLINEERKALFMSPLKWDENLGRAARYHASDMATQEYFFEESYDRVDGKLVQVATALDRNGQFYSKNKLQDLNIASGNLNANEAFIQWITYDDQYDVLFDDSSKKVGIGLVYDASSSFGYYWVLVTAKK